MLTDLQLVNRMFSNHRGERGLRLTKFGVVLMQACFTAYDISVPDDERLAPKHLIRLDQSATLPYYFDDRHIVVFDLDFGVKLRLVGGRLSVLMELDSN